MRKLVVIEFLIHDGVFQDPARSKEFDRGGWNFDFCTEADAQFKYKKLFKDGFVIKKLKLIENTTFKMGIVARKYEPISK